MAPVRVKDQAVAASSINGATMNHRKDGREEEMGGGRKERGGTHRRGGARRRLAGGGVTRQRRHACGALPSSASRKEEVHRRRRFYGEMGFRCGAGPSAATSASEKVCDANAYSFTLFLLVSTDRIGWISTYYL